MMVKIKLDTKGITLIELLVALVIGGIVVAGIYRVFVAQTKAYTVQDQVVEVQQNVRSTMEILLRDLRMAGYDDDNVSSLTIADPIVYPVGQNSVTVNYEYYNTTTIPPQYEKHTVAYWLNAGTSELFRQRTITINGVASASPQEVLLENVGGLNFRYGVDTNGDGAIDNNNWIDAAAVGTSKVIAIRVLLNARSDQTNPDVQKMVTPRTLESIVTLRNLCLIRN
jgi:prepilin-type N-terminal cleavage/methylation domain-containing protein